ncbi:hypothetical protein LCGC14_1838990 [marine sediment metagenome]|uniref:Uncharacterized protein n=1 Tax=marine sediment metagenome TaxID=412755 RepID=A0A0F9GDV0_9ZZZZ
MESGGNYVMPTRDIAIRLDLDEAALKHLDRAMKVLPEKVYARVVSSAARLSMLPALKAMKQRVNATSTNMGHLRDSLIRKVKKYKSAGVVYVVVGPENKLILVSTPDGGQRRVNPANYSHLVEYGTTAHKIGAPTGGLKIGPLVIRGTVDHPGAKAQPFARPAFDETKHKVIRVYRKKVLAGIERETRKLSK